MGDPAERDDEIEFTEEQERSWRAYLEDFRRDVFPVFEAHGFTLPEAFLAWQSNRVTNTMWQLITALAGKDDNYGDDT